MVEANADAEQLVGAPSGGDDPLLLAAKRRIHSSLKGWRITRLLGQGPTTFAYQAVRGEKDALERAVIRVLKDPFAKDSRAKSIFLRSAYAANRFNHPRVLLVADDGVDDAGGPFVLRPWIEARPLSELVAERPLAEKDVLRIAEQLLDALELGHTHGVVHGGIGPTNVLITDRGSMRLCDFATPPGLGAVVTDAEDDPTLELRKGPFMAPERCAEVASRPTEGSDIYSVAALMYFALTGLYPRGTVSRPDDLSHTEAIPLRVARPATSELLASVVDHALAIDPMRRYESAYAMLGDVRRIMVGRKPKLGDALAPVPSAASISLEESASLRPVEPSAIVRTSVRPTRSPRTRRSEARGNILLVLAIAALVGSATFFLVREKRGERGKLDAPDASARPAVSAPR